jgi:hypothetical protein
MAIRRMRQFSKEPLRGSNSVVFNVPADVLVSSLLLTEAVYIQSL